MQEEILNIKVLLLDMFHAYLKVVFIVWPLLD
jgi:hypothetical protein